ncbi:hypothetical protein JMF89_13435 [Clostridiaceae bacterium UIB06]|nr:hypothetical protein [Clostridiaceae bacterium UIB06]
MERLISGMILVEKTYGDLHTLLTTPVGWKVIDANGSCIDFDKENYSKAYIPKDYNDPWTPLEGTEVVFE